MTVGPHGSGASTDRTINSPEGVNMAKVVHLKKVPSVTSTVIGNFKAKSDSMMQGMREHGAQGFAMVAYKRLPNGEATIMFDGYFSDPVDQFILPYMLAEKIREER